MALPFATSLSAADYIAPEGSGSGPYGSYSNYYYNITEENGSLISLNGSELRMYDSYLGSASGGRFTMILDNTSVNSPLAGTNIGLVGTTAYIDSINFINPNSPVLTVNRSNTFIDTAIISDSLTLSIVGGVFKAPLVQANSVHVLGIGYAEFAANINNLYISESATWRSIGSSSIGQLSVSHSTITIDFCITSPMDEIVVNSLIVGEDATISRTLSFANSLLEELFAEDGFEGYIDIYNIDANFLNIVSTNIAGTINSVYVTETNGTYSWTVTEFVDSWGDQVHRLSDFVLLIPEPSTYATIFGVFALALAIYRRRK